MSSAGTPTGGQALAEGDSSEQPSHVAEGGALQIPEPPHSLEQPSLAGEPQGADDLYQAMLSQAIERLRRSAKWPPQYGEKSSHEMSPPAPAAPAVPAVPVVPPPQELKWQCGQCGKNFSSGSSLQRHHQIHTKNAKPHQCEDCGKCFTRINHLRRHLRIHSGDRPYKCKHCDKSFTRSDHLTIHLRTHCGDK